VLLRLIIAISIGQ